MISIILVSNIRIFHADQPKVANFSITNIWFAYKLSFRLANQPQI